MINRVLIRIKVVQMLYSYLLTQGEFKLQSVPENASRDKRFAHSMYVDMLLMLVRLSGTRLSPADRVIAGVDDNRYLPANKIARTLRADSDLKALAAKSGFSSVYGDDVVAHLHGLVTRSGAYRSYIRLKNRELSDDVKLLTSIVETILATDPQLQAVVRNKESYTAKGFDDAVAMTVATLEEIGDISGRYVAAKNSLTRSLDKAYELYHALLALPIELTRLEDMRIDANRHKFLATSEDLNPNMKMVDNSLVKLLEANPQMEEFFKDHPFSWNDDPVLLRSLLSKIQASEIYKEYMASPESSLKEDCEFWRNIYKTVILPCDDLAEALESMSVYWNDDLSIVGTFVLKTMRRVADAEAGARVLLPKFKDEEDAAFGGELFVDTIDHFDEYRAMIDRFIDRRQWDTERLAFMDVVIMATAISELLNYPAIPIAVTLNEYIEIANSYSTPRSGQFVNGILYSVINYLKEEGRLLKN
ncbi:MAG: transcription antitermination protein NusB [Bacteroides sp.]|nr:transcription antitermination protein NusB [Bacteroides sp.]MCM1412779.1 transcription antitermination protein NusB [Bacteroides sp.]MCM1470927.1 transcription antitermination protein NusB [Bacteroides sp.]